MTYREAVYMVLGELKNVSDDSFFTENHAIFLLNKYRAFLIKQKYSDIRKEIPESNYTTICINLIQVPAILDRCNNEIPKGNPCEGADYLRSEKKIPNIMTIGNTSVFPIDYYQGNITIIPRERMRYVGYNKYLKNEIYCSLGPDSYLYFKSMNPQFLYLEKVRMTAIFEDPIEASELECCPENICDTMDKEFPIEDSLVPLLIEMCVKELSGAIYRPKDDINNATDDLNNPQALNNVKSDNLKALNENQ